MEQALAHVEKSGERFGEADIHRVKGDLLLLSGVNEIRAVECYHQSSDISRRKGAKFWELRTAMNLARLWQKQVKPKEARELLAGIYGWFTEGIDTPDLIDAKACLKNCHNRSDRDQDRQPVSRVDFDSSGTPRLEPNGRLRALSTLNLTLA